jgi:hypothetical protein
LKNGRGIVEINRDPRSPYKVTAAVALGDFLNDRSRVQTVEVGVHLKRRNSDEEDSESVEEREAQQQFMRRLQGRIVRVRRTKLDGRRNSSQAAVTLVLLRSQFTHPSML